MKPWSRLPGVSRVPRSAQQFRWEQIRSRGRARFIWVRWVLGWGGGMALGLTVLAQFTHEGPNVEHVVDTLLVHVAICGMAAYVLGRWLWSRSNRKFPPQNLDFE